MNQLFSIGHSTYSIDKLIRLLKMHDIRYLIDVRSRPFSSWNTHFNLQDIKMSLNAKDIEYSWYGKFLGGLSKTSVKSDDYEDRIGRVLTKLDDGNVCVMCSEKNPAQCHRATKLSPSFMSVGVEMNHILDGGSLTDGNKLLTRIPPKLIWWEHDSQGMYGRDGKNI